MRRRRAMRSGLQFLVAFLLSAAADAAPPKIDAHAVIANVQSLLQGRFDNRKQVSSAPADDAGHAMPHVIVTIEPTPKPEWLLWHVHLETYPESKFDQTWALETRIEYDGSSALIPYYQFRQTEQPLAAAFDPQGWLSLEACALRGTATNKRVEGISEGEPCVAEIMGVGARRALLPVGVVAERDALRLDLNLRGVRTRIEAERDR